MKISKVFASIAVCGALIFPGVLSSSAQEINPSESPVSLNPTLAPDGYYAKNQTAIYDKSMGLSVVYTTTVNRPAPYAPLFYQGTLYYNSYLSKLNNCFLYDGIIYLQNK